MNSENVSRRALLSGSFAFVAALVTWGGFVPAASAAAAPTNGLPLDLDSWLLKTPNSRSRLAVSSGGGARLSSWRTPDTPN